MSQPSFQPVIDATFPATSPVAGALRVTPHALCRVSSANAAFVAEYTADATVDVHALTGLHGETTFEDIYFVIVELIKTAATSSGTCVITGAGAMAGFGATTVNAGSDGALAALSGDSIYTAVVASANPIDVTSGTNTIDLNFTNPVGFKARITVIAS